MVMAVIDPEIASLSRDIETFVDNHAKDTRAMVAKANKEAAAGTTFSIIFGLVAAGGALAFALWIGSRKIAAPLIATAKTMDILAQGSVDVGGIAIVTSLWNSWNRGLEIRVIAPGALEAAA